MEDISQNPLQISLYIRAHKALADTGLGERFEEAGKEYGFQTGGKANLDLLTELTGNAAAAEQLAVVLNSDDEGARHEALVGTLSNQNNAVARPILWVGVQTLRKLGMKDTDIGDVLGEWSGGRVTFDFDIEDFGPGFGPGGDTQTAQAADVSGLPPAEGGGDTSGGGDTGGDGGSGDGGGTNGGDGGSTGGGGSGGSDSGGGGGTDGGGSGGGSSSGGGGSSEESDEIWGITQAGTDMSFLDRLKASGIFGTFNKNWTIWGYLNAALTGAAKGAAAGGATGLGIGYLTKNPKLAADGGIIGGLLGVTTGAWIGAMDYTYGQGVMAFPDGSGDYRPFVVPKL